MANITILGSGSWGLALALTLYDNNHNITVWTKFPDEAEYLLQSRKSRFLPGIYIPQEIEITTKTDSFNDADIVVLAVPSFAIRETAKLLKDKNKGIIVNVAKGLEAGSLKTLSTVIKEETNIPVCVLSGPSHAEEVSKKVPTSIVAANENFEVCKTVIDTFSTSYLRIYSNNDVLGVELGGALKNVIAVAGGFCDGLELGDNSKAALITRGLNEIACLGCALGATENTFAGLSGLGDLIVTCNSRHSRNHRFGELIAKGAAPQNALATVGTVEGYHAVKQAVTLAEKMNIEMPITNLCYKVMYEGLNVNDAMRMLMSRPSKDEHDFLWVK